jgi:hypothetical protein
VHHLGEKGEPVTHPLPDPTDDARKLERKEAWDLTPLGLKEGDVVRVHAEAEDAYAATVDGKQVGPNVGRSPTYTLTVISEAEMASILREQQRELKEKLRKVIDRQADSKSEVDRLAAQAAKEPADRRKVSLAERGQRRIAATTESVATELDSVLEEMRNNKVGTLAEQERVENLATTLSQVADKDMPDAAQQIARAAQTAEHTKQHKHLADASEQQQNLLDTLRGALARFDQWHDIDELIRMASELLLLQKKLNDRTAELGRALIGKPLDRLTPAEKGAARSLARAQQGARDGMQNLETRMAEVARDLVRTDPAAAKLVDQAISQANSDQIRRKMDDAATRIEAARVASARPLQADATKALQRLIELLSRASSPYLAQDLRKLQEDIEKQLREIEKLLKDEKNQLAETAVANLRRGIQELRKQQQGTQAKTAKATNPDELKQQAPDQGQHAEKAESLSQDAAQSAELTERAKAPLQKAGKALEEAAQEMDKARASLADAQKNPAQTAQSKAIEKLDEADQSLAGLQNELAQGKPDAERTGERAQKQGETAEKTEQAASDIQKSTEQAQKIAPATAKTLDQAQQSTEQASESMSDAEQNLDQASQQQDGGPQQQSQAQQAQQQAVDSLEQAMQDLAQAHQELDMQRRQQEIFELEKLLAALLPKQVAIRESTETIAAETDGGTKTLTHAQTLATRDLAARQGGVREKAAAITERLAAGNVPVFLYTMREAEAGMGESQRLLGEKQVDWTTQEEQRQVERKLLQLIDALKEEAERLAKGDAPPPGGGGQGPSGPAPLVPPLAQLKQLKALQTEINQGTRAVELDKTTGRRVRKILLERRALRLHKRQADLGKLTEDFAKALEEAVQEQMETH